MFAIALQQQQYKTYVLTDDAAQSRLEVVPERGGIITSWRVQGKEIFYLEQERFSHPDLSVRGGMPILFPICGNLPDDIYTYKSQSYTLKQHGFTRDLPWEVSDSITQDLVSLTLVLDSNEKTRAVYPFDFQVAFIYKLRGNSLEIRQRYTNYSSDVMPFSTGLHPYFNTLDKAQLKLEIPSDQYKEKGSKITHPFNGDFDFNEDEIDVAFQQLKARSASVTDPSMGFQLQLSYDDNYSTLVFWAVKGKDFYCLEPWSAPRNALNTGEHLIHLQPGASCETVVGMTINFL